MFPFFHFPTAPRWEKSTRHLMDGLKGVHMYVMKDKKFEYHIHFKYKTFM